MPEVSLKNKDTLLRISVAVHRFGVRKIPRNYHMNTANKSENKQRGFQQLKKAYLYAQRNTISVKCNVKLITELIAYRWHRFYCQLPVLASCLYDSIRLDLRR